jgi:hypothetical protein
MDWSRKRLARELWVLWDWRNGMGQLKDFAARSFLLKLAERELIELPPVREYKPKQKTVVKMSRIIEPIFIEDQGGA